MDSNSTEQAEDRNKPFRHRVSYMECVLYYNENKHWLPKLRFDDEYLIKQYYARQYRRE